MCDVYDTRGKCCASSYGTDIKCKFVVLDEKENKN